MAETISMSTPVTIEAFVEELTKDPMKDWYTMGFLLGLYENTLKEIAWKHRPNGEIDDCLKEIYKTLKAQGVKLTWEQIIDALSTVAMDNKKLAEEVNQKYCGGKYTTTHGTDEERGRDEDIAKRLLEICQGQKHIPGIDHKGDGFFDVHPILRINPDITKNDLRRVVANNPALKLDRGKLKAHWGHVDEKMKAEVQEENKRYRDLSALCRFGQDHLHVEKDGSFSMKQIISGTKCANEEQIIRAIKNNLKSELILFKDRTSGELRIKHANIHPPAAKAEGGRYTKSDEEWLWSKVRTCCCKASEMGIPYDTVEGYLKIRDVIASISSKRHLAEDHVIDVVQNCPPNCKPGWLELSKDKHQVKATWGHVMDMPVERPCTTSKLTVAVCPHLVLMPIPRKIWVEQKKEGIKPTATNKINLFCCDSSLDNEEILDRYGCYCVIVVINMKKAIEDGLEFHRQGGERIICMKDLIPVKYFEKIL